jgi:hypothetical protein
MINCLLILFLFSGLGVIMTQMKTEKQIFTGVIIFLLLFALVAINFFQTN